MIATMRVGVRLRACPTTESLRIRNGSLGGGHIMGKMVRRRYRVGAIVRYVIASSLLAAVAARAATMAAPIYPSNKELDTANERRAAKDLSR